LVSQPKERILIDSVLEKGLRLYGHKREELTAGLRKLCEEESEYLSYHVVLHNKLLFTSLLVHTLVVRTIHVLAPMVSAKLSYTVLNCTLIGVQTA
jgi:hypothetical protein